MYEPGIPIVTTIRQRDDVAGFEHCSFLQSSVLYCIYLQTMCYIYIHTLCVCLIHVCIQTEIRTYLHISISTTHSFITEIQPRKFAHLTYIYIYIHIDTIYSLLLDVGGIMITLMVLWPHKDHPESLQFHGEFLVGLEYQ